MFRRNLFKRVLPVVLSVAMLMGDLPVSSLTAYAAESPTAVEESADAGEVLDVSTATVDGNDVVPLTEVVVDRDALVNWLGDTYDYTADTLKVTYAPASYGDGGYAAGIENAAKNVAIFKLNGQQVSDNETITLLQNQLTYKWQKADASGNYVDLADGELVKNAGKYQMIVSLAKVAGVCDAAADVIVKLEVEKSVVEIEKINLPAVRPGTTVAEVKETYKNLRLKVNNNYCTATDYATAAPELVFLNAHDASKTPLANEYVLKADEDYVLVVNVTLKNEVSGNYELGDTVFNFTLKNGYNTKVEITYTNAGAKIGKTYDGQAIDENTVKAAFTAAVKTDLTPTEIAAGEEEKTVANPALTYEWRDANKELMASAPVEAGTYYYRVVFEDPDSNYRSNYADVAVFIDMAKIVVAPVAIAEGVYAGDYVRDILKNVKYEVFDVVNGVQQTTPNTAYTGAFWGYAYNEDVTNSSTQIYEPVFAIEEGETASDGTVKWNTYDSWRQIRSGFSYRLIFTGYKAVYNTAGNAADTIDINSAQTNYTVDTTKAVLESNAKTLTVNATSPVTISTDAILQNGAGASFENAITVVYTGKDIYNDPNNKSAYKKAQALANGSPVASNTDSSLTYTWQRLGYNVNNTAVQDDQGNVKAPQKPTETSTTAERQLYKNWEDSWYNLTFNNVASHSSPSTVGIYRLKINYNDATHKNASAEGYVYYVIKPQDVAVKLDGTPSAYADGETTIAEFLSDLRTEKKLSEAEGTIANPISAAIYPVEAFTEAADGTATPTLKETEADKVTLSMWDNDTLTSYTAEEWMDKKPTAYYTVERKIKEGEKAGQWKEVEDYTKAFEADTEYRLIAKYTRLDADYANYNFGKKVGAHTQTLKEDYYKSNALTITIKKTEGKPVKINVDETKITNRSKVYDGKPFDLTELRSLITVETVTADGSAGTPVTTVTPKIEFWSVDDAALLEAEDALHAGTYRVKISTETDDTYYGTSKYLETVFVIAKRNAEFKPKLASLIKAGKLNDEDRIVPDGAFDVAGLAEGDEDAIESIRWRVYRAEENDGAEDARLYSNDILYSDETYYVKAQKVNTKDIVIEAYDEYGLPAYKEHEYQENKTTGRRKLIYLNYDRDYEWSESITAFTPVRAEAEVAVIGTGAGDATASKVFTDTVARSEAGEYSHTILPVSGVAAVSGLQDLVETAKTGKAVMLPRSHYFRFEIMAPEEYQGTYGFNNEEPYIYKNAIAASGAYITGIYNKYIQIAIDADAETKTCSFDILWKPDYVEHFSVDLTKASLLWDLTEAVAPKALKFNGASSKMTVGSTQQLDVKITKAQQADVIWLAYSVDNTEVLKVEDDGFVTALKAGMATVTVYPVKEDAEGNKVAIEGKGVKKATIKIKVTEVSAPKFSGLVAKDTYVNIKYKKPTDGLRREIYVLEGKAKPADFEARIKEVVNGDFSAFAVAPEFVTANKEVNSMDEKGVVGSKRFFGTGYGLKPNTQYTIYLRNVSGLRTMADGTTVAASAAGSVKSFKTLKAQEVGIDITPAAPAVYDEDQDDDDLAGNATLAGSAFSDVYKVKLSDKTVNINTRARFYERYLQTYSDTLDYIWQSLPLDKTLAKTYLAPKMVYLVADRRWNTDGSDGIGYNDAKKLGYVEFDGYYYEKTSKIASIDKNGKVTLKGKGNVFVVAYDTNYAQDPYTVNARYGDVVDLYIYASPNSMTAKPIKLNVGQTVELNDFLEYKEGSTKLINYEAEYADLTVAELSNENFKITKVGTTYAITALKSGKDITLNVTDKEVTKNGGSAVAVKVTSVEIPAVKGLKNYIVFDSYSQYTFQYPEVTFDFRVKLQDARGNVLYDRVETLWADPTSYNAKTKMWTYYSSVGNMTLKSQYNLTITAVYGDEVSKEAKLKIKTTDIPASYSNLKPTDKNTGMRIYTTTQGGSDRQVTTGRYTDVYGDLLSSVVLKSGNDYTLIALPDASGYTAVRMTDTLTWKSSNTKVASVKAKSGTMTALLKTNKPGTTEISVTSKVTKKVIARWEVAVSAIGEAGLDGQYFGTNEPYDNTLGALGDYGFDANAVNDIDAVAVTMGTEINTVLYRGQSQYFVFTAPANGRYTVNRTNMNEVWTPSNGNSFNTGELQKGQVVIAYAENNNAASKNVWISVTGNMYQAVEAGADKKFAVKGGTTISFIAPEDNYYYAVYQNDGETKASYHESTVVNKDATGTITIAGNPNKQYEVSVVKRETTALTAGSVALDKYDSNPANIKWLSFKAEEDNTYKFTFTTAEDSNVQVRYYESIPYNCNSALQNTYGNADDTYYSADFVTVTNEDSSKKDVLTTAEYSLKAGDTVYFALTTTKENAAVTGAYTAKEVPAANTITLGEDKQIVVGADDKTENWYKFTAAEDGWYSFFASNADSYFSATDYYKNLAGDDQVNLFAYMNTTNPSRKAEKQLKAGQTIYLKFEAPGADNDTQAKLVLNISKITATALAVDTENAISVTPTGTWYSVTVPETGVYTYEFKNGKLDEADLNVNTFTTSQYSSLKGDYVVSNINNKAERVYSAGQTFYLYITNNNATKTTPAKASLTIKRRAVPAANKLTTAAAGNSLSLAATETWYSFTAEENNYYTFSYSNDTDTTKTMTDMRYYSNLLTTGTGSYLDGNTLYLTKGETIYVRVTAEDGTTGETAETTAKANIRITKRTVASTLSMDNNGLNAVTISKDQVAYYSFTAPEDNKYTFETKVTSEDNGLNDVYYGVDLIGDIDNDWSYLSNTSEYPLEGGKTYYIRVRTTVAKEATAQITIKKREVAGAITVAAEPKTISLAKKDTTSYYTFTAMTTGYYTFTASDVKKGVSYGTNTKLTNVTATTSLSASDDMRILSARQMRAGDMIYFAFETGAEVTDEDPAKINIAVSVRSDADVQKLAVGNDAATNTIKLDTKNQIKWYSFTSSEDNVYSFALQGLSGGKMYVSYNGGASYEYADNGTITSNRSIATEKTVYIAAYATDVTTPVSATVVISKREIKETLNADDTAKRVTLPKDGSEVWYKFQPTEKGIYTVYALDGSENVYAYEYAALGNTGNVDYEYGKVFRFAEEEYDGKEKVRYFSFKLASTQEEDKYIDIYVVKRALASNEALSESGTDVTLTQNKAKWYQIKATKAGYYHLEYVFKKEDVEAGKDDLTAVFYDEFDSTSTRYVGIDTTEFDDDGNEIVKCNEIWLENGESIYVKVYSDTATKETSIKASLKAKVNAPTAWSLTAGMEVLLLGEKDKTYVENTYVFTAPREDQTQYLITIKNEDTEKNVQYAYASGSSIDNDWFSYGTALSNSSYPSTIYVNLEQNESVVLKLGANIAETESVKTTVKIQYRDSEDGKYRPIDAE